MTPRELVEDAFRDVRDADRCVALGITPATHQLHRRLREVTAALSAALDFMEAEADRMEGP